MYSVIISSLHLLLAAGLLSVCGLMHAWNHTLCGLLSRLTSDLEVWVSSIFIVMFIF